MKFWCRTCIEIAGKWGTIVLLSVHTLSCLKNFTNFDILNNDLLLKFKVVNL